MYIYNVTINIDNAVHDEWLTWMETHIIEVLNTGKFISAKFTQVLVEEEMEVKHILCNTQQIHKQICTIITKKMLMS